MSLESNDSADAGDGNAGGRQRRRLLDDPLSIRALAHPLRLELQAIVGRAGKITAADAARELDISQALASHHLRQLAKYGFVEQVAGDDNRARPWRVTSTSHSWKGADEVPERAAAAAVLEQLLAERAVGQLVDWQERRDAWPARWRELTGIGESTVYLTVDELAELAGAIEGLIGRYVEERPIDDLDSRPPGSVPVDVTYLAIPLSKHADGQ
ncbi:MAG: helix-turn-helix domain-containing protein [Nocardioidaceae bacterium]